MNAITTSPIDAVITWVDGNEPAHRQKLAQYLTPDPDGNEFKDGSTRYASVGEIYYCVASILKFAPFVRKIYIVTDQQNPQVDNFVAKHFPKNQTPIELVDHTVIFKGLESFLPSFNSMSIESCLYRIPDLSDCFVYFNDDCFLLRPITPSTWVRDGQIQLYGNWRTFWFNDLKQYLRYKLYGKRKFSFKHPMIQAARYLGYKSLFFYLDHTPHLCHKPTMEAFYNEHPELLELNLSYKFRDEAQFNPQALFYLIGLKSGICKMNTKMPLMYIKPVGRSRAYLEKKINGFIRKKHVCYGCINSLDMASEENQNFLTQWLRTLLQLPS